MEVTPAFLHKQTGRLEADGAATFARDVLNRAKLDDVMFSAASPLTEFNITLPEKVEPLNQEASGRCWIFAGLNVIRRKLIRKHKLPPDFALSASFISYHDKIEKCNTYFEVVKVLIREKRLFSDNPDHGAVLSYLRAVYLGDGGTFAWLQALVAKYGLVPESAYPSNQQANHTATMNKMLQVRLDRAIQQLSKDKSMDKKIFMADCHRIITTCMGIPPTNVQWSRPHPSKAIALTPLQFYHQIVQPLIDIDQYIQLVHDPRFPFNRWLAVEGIATCLVEQKTPDLKTMSTHIFLNVELDVIKAAVHESLVDEHTAVWFTGDVATYAAMNRALLIMPAEHSPLKNLFGDELITNKRQMYESLTSYPNHAMVFVGILIGPGKEITRFQVENSWGVSLAKGFVTMSDAWFNCFLGAVAVPKSMIKNKNTKDTIWLPYWDVHGTVAD